ncbi:MAG: hypothetical protein Q9217_001582 [Psora testacea]
MGWPKCNSTEEYERIDEAKIWKGMEFHHFGLILSAVFAAIAVMVIEGGCVTIAMYCLIQFYVQIKDAILEHQPLLKIAAIKLVIFLSFWQTLLISFLTSSGAIKPSSTIQTPDIKIGIPSMLLCIEMSIFSIFHFWAFPWKAYDIRRSAIVVAESAPGFLPDPKTAYQGGRLGHKALMDAFNPWDLVKAVGRGFKWAAVGRRRRMEDISYKSSHQSAGLEPTRNQFTAFQNSPGQKNPFDLPSSQGQNTYLKKTPRYTPLSAEEDSDRLLMHAQPNPSSAPLTYPRPMERLPPRSPALGAHTGDIGTLGTYDPPPSTYHLPHKHTYQDSSGHLAATDYGIASTPPERKSLESQDTSYRSPARSERRVTPTTVPPDSTPLGPPGRSSEQTEWDMWASAHQRGEDERDLGGGHGVGDNRF